MTEPYMTMADIETKYPNEWVLIDNPKTSRVQEILGGHVVGHSPDRSEFLRLYEAWDKSKSRHLGIWFTGEVPEPELLPLESETGAA